MPTAMDYAARIAATAPLPSRALKRFVMQTLPKSPTEMGGMARAEVDAIFASEDWAEGRSAFADKRPPVYRGK
jgi:1,4-dihydroxy-2-naphthoyl-CoA synthase